MGSNEDMPIPDAHLTAPPPRPWVGLFGWLAGCALVAALGGLASVDAPAFYAELSKPGWAPPAGAFGPVWGVLYTLMAIAAWLVWRRAGWAGARLALSCFVLQLALNAAWSWLFFGWRLGGPALLDVGLLLLAVLATIATFWRHDRLAAALLLPYLAWLGLASALNAWVWQANPALLG